MKSVSPSVITNHYLSMKDALEESFSSAVSVDIIVSFMKESGLFQINNFLCSALNRGVKVRILTGTYLGITSPFALEELLNLKGDLEIHIFSDESISFHPKSYLFHSENSEDDVLFIGSSNLSNSALTSGIEWNYRFKRSMDPDAFRGFQEEFEFLFFNRSILLTNDVIEVYKRTWKNPVKVNHKNIGLIPEGPQISALNSLARTRADGMEKAILVAATGVGKTFIAAEDSRGFKKILFIAHRIEILKQAMRTFESVHIGKSCGLLVGGQHDCKSDMIFASIQTLRLNNNYRNFSPDCFDYIVVDEFHHAASDSYSEVISYFKPKFLLGLTATPDRGDNRDVFALCDYNVPYEISMSDAIRYGRLVPFTYHGISDDTDYSGISYFNGKYDPDDLNKALNNEHRAELILKHYMKYPSKRAIGFCSSREHASFMRSFFNRRGINSCAVFSSGDGLISDDREESITDLENEKISVIFTVDMFNEGVDIPSIDMVMFLRPTESSIVFMQQLGRGLRKYDGKARLNVLDFIGNYRNVHRVPSFLIGKGEIILDPRKIASSAPTDCVIDFDLKSIDLMKEMSKKFTKIQELIDSEFQRIREELGHIPSRIELFMSMDEFVFRKAKENNRLFRNYLRYLDNRNLTNPIEKSFIGTPAERFLESIETTGMKKLYKMAVLLEFYNGGDFKLKASFSEIADALRNFYSDHSNRIDLAGTKHQNPDKMSEDDWISMAKRDPIRYLTKSNSEFFKTDEYGMYIDDSISQFTDLPDFKRHVLDAIKFRIINFKKERYDGSE